MNQTERKMQVRREKPHQAPRGFSRLPRTPSTHFPLPLNRPSGDIPTLAIALPIELDPDCRFASVQSHHRTVEGKRKRVGRVSGGAGKNFWALIWFSPPLLTFTRFDFFQDQFQYPEQIPLGEQSPCEFY